MRKRLLLFLLLALFSGCERYHVVGKVENENGAILYLKDNSTGKVYGVAGNRVFEVPLP